MTLSGTSRCPGEGNRQSPVFDGGIELESVARNIKSVNGALETGVHVSCLRAPASVPGRTGADRCPEEKERAWYLVWSYLYPF